MRADNPDGPESLPLSVARRIDEVCVRFEAAWQAGQSPRIEDFLGDTPRPERETLLWELLRIEIDSRLHQDNVPRVEEYVTRFPNREQLLRKEIEERVARATGRPRLNETMKTHGEGAGGRTFPYVPEPATEVSVPGYEVRGPLGEGGMAKVYRVHDADFDRSLAIKVMKTELAQYPEARNRFLAEARITGRLQHPGIPPVHEIGHLDDGRPFLAMKLIEGETLHDLLKRRSTAASELPRFVAIFGQVCQTIGYAHSQGVLHRDLKPANLMVGAFGEVQVMDWGLARECAARETATVLGTPAFMAPEQARGEIDRIDERADVFGLGAILCVILTGEPAFVGVDVRDVLGQAALGRVSAAFRRLDACGADAELIALAKQCLAADLEQRPRDGSAVAAAVQAYQTGVEERARKAEVERAAAQARAEEATAKAKAERRARLLTVGLAAVLLLAVVGGGIAAWMIQQKTAANAQGIRTTMAQGRSLLKEGWEQNNLAKLTLAKAAASRALDVARASNASTPLQGEAESLLEEVEEKITATKKNNALLAAWLDVSEPRETARYTTTKSGQMLVLADLPVERQFADALGRWGLDVDKDSLENIVARLGAQPEPVVQEIVNGLDAWALDRRRKGKPEARWRRLLAVAERLDSDAGRKGLRRLLASSPLKRTPANAAAWEQARSHLLEESKQVKAAAEPVRSLLARVRVLRAFGETATAEALLRSALARHPGEVVLLVTLGELLKNAKPPRLEKAIGCYRAARSVRPQLGLTLGKLLVKADQASEGEVVLRDLERLQFLTPELQFNLGVAQYYQKKLAAAETAFRQAIQLKHDYAPAYSNLGVILWEQKKLAEAETAFRKAIQFKPDDAAAYYNLGLALNDQKKPEEAEAAYRQAIQLNPHLAEAYCGLGIALCAQKKLSEAVAVLQKAIQFKPDDAVAYSNLGIALSKQKKRSEAMAAYKKAIQLQPDYAAAHCNLGNALYAEKKLAEAEAAYRKATQLQPDFAKTYSNLGNALLAQKKLSEAVAAFQKAIALQPDLAEVYSNLGNALYAQNKLEEAEATHRKAIQLQPDYAEAYTNLGVALYAQKKLSEAEAAHRKAIQLQPDFAKAYCNLGIVLHAQKKLSEAVAAIQKAIELQPDLASAYNNLGIALSDQKKLSEGVAAFLKATKLNPDYAEAYSNLGVALSRQKKLSEAAAAYQKAIALQPDFARAYIGLGDTLYAQKKLAEAVAVYQKADQLLPHHPGIRPNLRRAERWLQLEKKLSLIQAGKETPQSARERIQLGYFCVFYKQYHAAAVGFFSDAFTADPKLAGNLQAQYRYLAASAAARAAAGKGEDARGLRPDQQGKLRVQARDWLRADLDAYAKLSAKAGKGLRQALRQRVSFWLQDDDLATVRDAKALAALPEQERKAWQQLWADVAALLKKCQ